MILSVENLSVQFPTRRGTLVALDSISFHINPGEILGVVGESGAGKSITGLAIIGLLEPPGRIASVGPARPDEQNTMPCPTTGVGMTSNVGPTQFQSSAPVSG